MSDQKHPSNEPEKKDSDEKQEDVEMDDIEESGDDLDDDDEKLHDPAYYRTIKIVPADERVTSEIMTMFEFSEVIGIRAAQIEAGGQVFTDTADIFDPRDKAKKELFDRRCPLMIIRNVRKGEQEVFKCNEMGFPADARMDY